MACWLVKEEPTHYSFDDLVRDRVTVWDGIRNALALRHLRSARKGDEALYYHTGKVKAAVGLARIASDPYPEPGAGDPRFAVVELEAWKPLASPATLASMRANAKLSGLDLLRISRLSFLPVAPEHWREILRMAGQE